MILTESFVKVPGKMYKIKVQCVSTRRLTAMEWLIVNCALRFQYSDYTVKYVFEEIFQLTSSEILIKPCIRSLISEKAIVLDAESNFDYSTLGFSQIHLTEKGERMAQDGLFPGETRELPIDIYYNPLTGKMNQFSGGNDVIKDAIDFGTDEDYDQQFPEEKIILALHKGMVGKGKFVASKLRIENIECLASIGWENYVKLEVDVDSKGIITTKPEIKEKNVKHLVHDLFYTKEITPSYTDKLIWREEADPFRILGSGMRIKDTILEVCRNGNILGLSEDLYALFKRNTSAFKKKVIILWNAKEFSFTIENEMVCIRLPFEFSIKGCGAINDKNESVSLSKSKCVYDGNEIIVPVAFEDRKIGRGTRDLKVWLAKVIMDNHIHDIRYLALHMLSLFLGDYEQASDILASHIEKMKPRKVVEELTVLKEACNALNVSMIKLNRYGDLIWSIFKNDDVTKTISLFEKLIKCDCIDAGSDTQRVIIRNVLDCTKAPRSYSDLIVLLQSVGIRTHDDALLYDDLAKKLYTKEVILDAFNAIMNDKYKKIPELFELDCFFNDYHDSIKALEFLITDFVMFDKSDPEQIIKSIDNCPDVALIQASASELVSQNMDMLKRGINIHTEFGKINSEKAECYFANMDVIMNHIGKIHDDAMEMVRNDQEKLSGKSIANRMYVIDTCALIHHPDLLLYFQDDESIRIPTKVIDELGKIKDMRSDKYGSDLARTAAKIASDIEKCLRIFNLTNRMRITIENCALDLLPADLDKNVPDNQILSVALNYKDWDTTIISDDGVFRLATYAQNIKAVTSDQFIKDRAESRRDLSELLARDDNAGMGLAGQNKKSVVLPKNQEQEGKEVNLDDEEDIDAQPVKMIKVHYKILLTEKVINYLQNNGIKTVGQFKALTPKEVEAFKAKGNQTVLKNNVLAAVEKYREISNSGME